MSFESFIIYLKIKHIVFIKRIQDLVHDLLDISCNSRFIDR